MTLRVVLRASARDDLRSIFEWLNSEIGPEFARDYVRRIRNQCFSLSEFPNRGRSRVDIAQGLRTILFEGRALIVYTVDENQVQILGVLHHGRDIDTAFKP